MEVEAEAGDATPAGENVEKENQDQECEPVQLIPNGFVVDDSLPSISFEDFSQENDVWLVDLPVAVDPQKLMGQQLDFRQEASFIIDEQNNEKCVSLPSDGPCGAICLLSSIYDNSKKIVSLNPSGKISISVNYDVPAFGAMIPDGTSVPLPVGLKVRHPFLGTGFKSPLGSMDEIYKNSGVCVTQNEKEQMVDEDMPTDMTALKEVARERLNLISIKKEVLSPKKSKKRKRESLDENGDGKTPENFGDVSVHLSKKHKKEKVEESNFQEGVLPEIPVTSEANEIVREEAISVKKSKKHKKRESEITGDEVDISALPEEADDSMSSPLVDALKKKIKKKKLGHQGSGDRIVDISMLGSPKELKRKKKSNSEILSGTQLDIELPTDVVMIEDASTHTSRVIGSKTEHHGEINNRKLSAIHGEGSDVLNEFGLSSPKIKKEKSKKRQTLEGMGSETIIPDVDDIHVGVGRKIKEPAGENEQKKDIEILLEEGDHGKKKKKKDKRRESEVMSSESDLQSSRAEVCVLPDNPETTPRKKVKEERRLKGVADLSLVEFSVPLEFSEETPKKAKKKKKRDSEIDDSTAISDVGLDVVLVGGKSIQSPEVKITKELKRELDGSVLEVSNVGEGDVIVKKSKKKKSLNKAEVEDIYLDSQDPIMVIGRQEMRGVKTEEEVDILMECGEHLKKKKDKKRESELWSLDMDQALTTGMDVTMEMPEGTLKKKKKKIKEELDSSMNLERTIEPLLVEQQLSLEGDSESTKKTKKKKKRESEHGNGVGDPSEDVEVTGEVTEVRKSKKEKWYIDPEPSHFEPSPEKNKKIKKVHREEVLDAHLLGGSSANNLVLSSSKKMKKRHTMDVADTSALIAKYDRVNALAEVNMEGKSHHKKRQSLIIPGSGSHLLSPKKEKIKREHIE